MGERSMSTWDYRVLKRTDQKSGEVICAIHEVYYDDAGKPEGCTEDSVAPMGESLAELKEDMDHYQQALDTMFYQIKMLALNAREGVKR